MKLQRHIIVVNLSVVNKLKKSLCYLYCAWDKIQLKSATKKYIMEQSTALAILKSGRNVFVTGSAGSGKTYIINQYIKFLKERRIPVAVTASTGIAATHMNGMTIHAWSGIGVRNHVSKSDLATMREKKYLREKLKLVRVLIIDEISMLHKNQLNLVNKVLKYFKETEIAFGGIQVIFSGDFFQLPPIGMPTEKARDKFAFMSSAWLEANPAICYLQEQHRQKDNRLHQILNDIRDKNISVQSRQWLEARKQTETEEGSTPPVLFTHNQDVSRTNNNFLTQLEGKMQLFKATTKGNKKLLELLKKSVRAPEEIYLKIGAKVMFVKNNYELNYVNGSLAEVVEFLSARTAVVAFADGRKLEVATETWSIEDEMGKTLASYNQIPLRLAWAITVHKSQGMTLDNAVIDLSKTFEKGQGYVALSRLKDLEGLYLNGINDKALEVDDLAYKADLRFRELSSQQDKLAEPKELERKSILFIKFCGGITDPVSIKQYQQKLLEKKKNKASHLISMDYIKKGYGAAKIATERGLAESTIIGHIIKLSALFPEYDLSQYCPDKKMLNRVKNTYATILGEQDESKLRDDGKVNSKALFEAMNQEIGYPEIRLALHFLGI